MSDLSDILADAQAFDAELRSRLVTATKDAADKGRAKAMQARRWKDRTGATADSITSTGEATAEGGEATLEADGENAVRLMEGTRPHPIYPKEGEGFVGPVRQGQSRRSSTDIGTHRRALRFEGPGGVRFARMVNHPGTAPDPYMDAAGDVMESELDAAVDGILGALLG